MNELKYTYVVDRSYIEVAAIAGTALEDAIKETVELAKLMDKKIVLRFNNTTFDADPKIIKILSDLYEE